MADKKISQLTALSAANLAPSTDVLAIVDTSATETKKIVAQDLINGVLNVASAVGIGTASPSNKLTVQANDVFNQDSSGQIVIKGSSNTAKNLRIGFDTTSDYGYIQAIESGVATRSLALQQFGGNVGIGTASPGYKLHVVDNSTGTQVRVASSSSGGTSQSFINTATNGRSYRIGSNFVTGTGEFALYDDTAGAARLTVDSSGNLGLGVTPSAWGGNEQAFEIRSAGSAISGAFTKTGATNGVSLALNSYYNAGWKYVWSGGSFPAMRYEQDSGGHFWFTAASGTAGNTISFTQAMTLDASGNLLVGTTTSSGKTTVVYSSTSSFGISVENQVASPGVDGSAVFANLSSATGTNAGTAYLYRGRSAGADRFYVYGNGGIGNYQANDVNLSDKRVKTDIKPVGSYWDKIKAIEIVTFKYKDQTHNDENVGVIAQQVEAVAPEFVDVDGFDKTPEDGVPLKTVYTTDMYHAAIKALQEAMARIESLEADVAALKGAK